MYEYIKRTDAIAEINRGDLLVGNCAEWAIEIIQRTPCSDVVEVKHGHWIDSKHAYGFFSPRCSVCHQFNKYHEKYNYCPNCGAKMDKE